MNNKNLMAILVAGSLFVADWMYVDYFKSDFAGSEGYVAVCSSIAVLGKGFEKSLLKFTEAKVGDAEGMNFVDKIYMKRGFKAAIRECSE
jgi:hypothetical protein